jgi:hypothetical protein
VKIVKRMDLTPDWHEILRFIGGAFPVFALPFLDEIATIVLGGVFLTKLLRMTVAVPSGLDKCGEGQDE